MTSSKVLGAVVVVLFVAIAVAVGFMFFRSTFQPTPTPADAGTSTPQKPDQPSSEDSEAPPPLSSRVVVTSPQAGQQVGQSFTVAGQAPGGWFFEAQFPIQVRDGEGNVVGRATATAQGEWMTEKQVTFTASMHIDAPFHGGAKLILMKDNPSGMPEHDDAVEIPITID